MENKGIQIYSALSAMQKEISEKGIGKSSSATDNKGNVLYKFRGIDDIYNLLAPFFHKHGIVLNVNCLTKETKAVAVKHYIQYQTFVSVEYTFISTQDGSSSKTVMFGEAYDNGDKGLAKALSMAFKYACFQIFCIPLPDPDPDQTVHERVPAQDFHQNNFHDYNRNQNNQHSYQNNSQDLNRTITVDEAKHLIKLVRQISQDPAQVLTRYKIQRFGELRFSQYQECVVAIQRYIQNNAQSIQNQGQNMQNIQNQGQNMQNQAKNMQNYH